MKFYKERFEKLRKQGRWSLGQLAKYCGVDPSTLSRWESGKNFPSESHVRILANTLNISVNEISDLPDNKQNAFLDGIKELNELANLEKDSLQKEEDYFITRIKRQIRQIEKANLVVNSLLNSMHSIFYIKDSANKYVLANSEFVRLVDLPHFSDIDGKTDDSLFSIKEAEQNARRDQKVLALEKEYINQQAYIPGTRKKKWGLMTKVAIRNEEGRVEGMLCTIKDITEEKKANELNQELKSAISNIQDVVWTGIKIDYKLKYTSVNDATEKLLGVTEEEFFKNEWINNVHPDFIENVKNFQKSSKDSPKQIEFKYIHPATKGALWLQNRINTDQEYHFGIIRDITDAKKQKDIEALLYKVIDSMPNVVWIATMDPEFKYYFLSNAIEEYSGIPKQKFLENPKLWASLRHPDDSGAFSDWKSHKECPSYYSYRVIRPDGKIRKVDEAFFKGTDYEGNEIYYGILRDITK